MNPDIGFKQATIDSILKRATEHPDAVATMYQD